jgi:hypothetical protein
MADPDNPRLLRLLDLQTYESVVIACGCGRIIEYAPGVLQRLYRVRSDMLIFDLQFRLRCRHCNATRGFRISVVDKRQYGDNSAPNIERTIVAGEG